MKRGTVKLIVDEEESERGSDSSERHNEHAIK